ncbi:site-2 protease family protein [Natronococcus wangiae]|uniref:site-2 protease family protein n=1 Tax=Natronococcus wangiae TaxID=3068275 RepID=UPI00273E80D8|nr:site-2 protease family protein [Natronococcus sp. AD5]
MSTSFTIGRIGGIPIRINISLIVFLPILAWLIGSGAQITVYASIIDGITTTPINTAALQAGSTPWVVGAAAAIGLFVSVTIHELGHSWVARRYGIVIQSITLWIFGGVASMETIPKEWNREFWIAIAGPITSLTIGGLCFLALQMIPAGLPVVLFVVGWLAVMNVVLALFNLLPAFPMDGGRVFRALLARWLSYTSATHLAARVGELFAVLFAIIGVLSFNVVLILVALFVYGAAVTEYRTVALTELLEGLTVADVIASDLPMVAADTPIDELSERMIRERSPTVLVVEPERVSEDGNVVGIATLDNITRTGKPTTVTVGDVVARETGTVSAEAAAMDALMQLWSNRADQLLVEKDGHVIGAVTGSDIIEVADLRKQAGIV